MKINRGMGTPATVAIVAVVIVVVGAAYYNLRPEGEIMVEKGNEMMEEGEKMMEEGEDMMHDGEAMMDQGTKMIEQREKTMEDGTGVVEEGAVINGGYKGEVLAGVDSGPVLLDFVKEDYDKAIADGKLVTLFFFATWCPLCQIEFPKMEAAFDELLASSHSDVQNVVGFRVNFNDGSTDKDEKNLAREFGVGYQHTKVFVKNGERILKSPESWDKERYLSEIKTALGI